MSYLFGMEQRLEKIRKLKGFSQEYVAERIKVSQNLYSKIERGEKRISLKMLEEICKVLEIELKTLQNFDPFQEFRELAEEASIPWLKKVLDSLEKATRLYEDLLQEKNERIKDLEYVNALLKKNKST
ncbi:MAG TPA: helix-turn-helix domain-containing protein [Bacteroidia bacterium]|nr:helix-turn-helix domain-containing protein [Bacteroidia bacterium]